MTIKDLLTEYVEGDTDAISVIRQLSGAFNPDHAVDILAIICTISRTEQGDVEKEDLLSILGLK